MAWQNQGEWCGAEINSAPTGWRVALWSRISGERDGRVLLLPYGQADVPRGTDLDAPATGPYGCMGDWILAQALRDGRVLKHGRTVR